MAESINSTLSLPVATSARDVLTDILRDGGAATAGSGG